VRVLFLSQIVPYPPHGGVLQRGYHILRELGAMVRVHLLAFVHPDQLPTRALREESQQALSQFCERVEYFPLWAKRSRAHRAVALGLSACSTRPFSVVAHRSAAFQRAVTESLRVGGYDLVHVDTLALAQFLGSAPRIPTVLTHHNVESLLMERRAEVERRAMPRRFLQHDARKLRAFESVAAHLVDVNVMVSSNDERSLRGMVPAARTAVVPNGVDIGYFTPDGAAEAPALIYTGGMNMFANRDAVLFFLREVWPLVTAEDPEVRFYAVGQDPPPALREMAARDPRVVVTGYVPDIRPLVRQAAVYVVPLRVGGGTRLKVLDAMAMGKAMVSTTIGCEGIEAQPDEHLIVADAPATFARATLKLLGDRHARCRLGHAARRLVETRYSWPVIIEHLLDAYRQAIDSGGRKQ